MRHRLLFRLILGLILLLAIATNGIAASISGTLSYNGTQTGPLFVAAFTSPLNCSPPNTINGYVDVFASNLSPSNGETVIGPPVFSWTGVNGPYTYGVEVDDYSTGRIWEVHELTDTTVTYGDPSLTPGNTYYYNVLVNDNEGNFSLVS